MRISTSTKYIDEQLFQNNSPQAIQDFKNKYKLENFLTTLDFYPRQGNRMVYSITYQGQDVSGKEWDLVVANAGWIYGNNNSMTPYMQRIVEPATNMITKTKWIQPLGRLRTMILALIMIIMITVMIDT